jgi:hypothetical protein
MTGEEVKTMKYVKPEVVALGTALATVRGYPVGSKAGTDMLDGEGAERYFTGPAYEADE